MKQYSATYRVRKYDEVNSYIHKDDILNGLIRELSKEILKSAKLPIPTSKDGILEYRLDFAACHINTYRKISKDLLELKYYKELCEDSHGSLVHRKIEEDVIEQLLGKG